jgi:hypothetical protein
MYQVSFLDPKQITGDLGTLLILTFLIKMYCRRRTVCRYLVEGDDLIGSESEGGNAGQSAKKQDVFATSWPIVPRELHINHCPSIRLSMLLIDSLSDVFPAGLSGSMDHYPPTDQVVHSQISHIISADGKDIDSVTWKYFQGVHIWLPILSQKRFFDRLTHSHLNPSPEFSVLLLAMRLLTQHPSTDEEADHDREVLYLATKTFFGQVQAFTPSSLLLTQAGIMLAHYEHAHGMIEGAYITTGTAARMAFALGLQNTHCSLAVQGTDSWLDEEEALSTWWGLVILDRYLVISNLEFKHWLTGFRTISFDPQMNGRPLATRPIRDSDYLPVESDDMVADSEFKVPMTRYFVSALNLPAIGAFGREAQATYLYDKVRLTIDAGKISPYYLYPLGRELQTLLSTVMEQVAGRCGVYCGATQMLIMYGYPTQGFFDC